MKFLSRSTNELEVKRTTYVSLTYTVSYNRNGMVTGRVTREFDTEEEAMKLYRSVLEDGITDLKVMEKRVSVEERRIV